MTAIQARATHVPTPARNLTFARQLRSEYLKLTSVRGTWWSVAIVAVITIGIAILVTSVIAGPVDNIMMAVLMPVQFTMLIAAILGVISVTGEYSTGMIRSTFTASPARGSVLAAKTVVLGAFMFIVSLVVFGIAAAAITPIAAGKDMPVAWADPEKTILPILAASAVMALFALLGVGLGFLLRSGAGAIAVTVGIVFILPTVLQLMGMWLHDLTWIMDTVHYLPASVAPNVIMPSDGAPLSVPASWATLAAWPAAALLGSWAVLRARDV
jgi:ABC-2 type transport system permease protein